MNNLHFRAYYRRRLPHFQLGGATYFITFRLINSLPSGILESLSIESKRINSLPPEIAEQEHHRWFGKYDSYLDNCTRGELLLKDPCIADIVARSIHLRDNNVYDLYCYAIMPNHVHLVYAPKENSPGVYFGLGEILHSLKRYTSREANKVLGRSGPFWQSESYDHIIRDQDEFERILKYILYNPVKAGLTDDWTKWKWLYCRYDL